MLQALCPAHRGPCQQASSGTMHARPVARPLRTVDPHGAMAVEMATACMRAGGWDGRRRVYAPACAHPSMRLCRRCRHPV
eukprot:260620-Chlamydomonas_euryale.AAC.1